MPVYLPGALGTAAFWAPVAERLPELGPAVRLGWPGFGDEPHDPAVRSVADLVGWTLARLPAGASDVVAQSMGGVVATLLALDHPERVRRLVLCATSGGIDVAALGAADWRVGYSRELPDWFVVDRTDVTDRLSTLRAPTLVVYGDADPLCPEAVARALVDAIPGATLARVPGGGHTMAHDRAGDVAPLVRRHLAGPPT
ncbi:alpha/beta fold hydrolase [Cellulomonas sp. URHD0024]|uniref:alpha/beta fold hydrolase n=1 Tax=Cellulomonas sp. URHD0024 TaxID=1302620 RepID=UPI000414F6D2|nr:alpha/beta fold hydrolase [Cellulomonas sp. URHD0024]